MDGINIHTHIGSVDIQLSTDRIINNLKEAHKLLNEQIVADCDPLIPIQQGALRGSVRYPQGVDGDEIEYNSPYAHYMYKGIVYGPNYPIKDAGGNVAGWYSPPKKYATGKAIQYHNGGGSEWFEKAKQRHKQSWIDLVKKEAGKE